MIAVFMVAWSLAVGVPTTCYEEQFPWQAMAVYDTVNHHIYLGPETCTMLGYMKHGPADTAAIGLLVYGHELAHARGVASHAQADCIGQRRAGVLARQLGATWRRSQKLASYARDLIFQQPCYRRTYR